MIGSAIRKCRVCGCHEAHACYNPADGTCSWAEEDLCSHCVPAVLIGTISLQERVAPWMQECFGPEVSADKLERGDRLLEEVLELLQSGDYPRDRIRALEAYVYDRPKGEPAQEVGGVMVTLAAYCLPHGLDMHAAGEAELERISQPDMMLKIRAKQAAKPTGSALPIRCAEVELDALGKLEADVKAAFEAMLWDGSELSGLFETIRAGLRTPSPQIERPTDANRA